LRTPRILILDEPTNGLDAQGIHELRTMFVDLVAAGTTIMLSSHLLAEVELICTRAAMMSAGRIVVQDRVSDLLSTTGWVRVVTADVERAERMMHDGPFEFVRSGPDEIRVMIGGRPSELLNRAFVEAGVGVREMIVERKSLEDVFLERTGDGEIR
jgi:ABC-2 type transport system ATP-binding protein